MDINLGKIEATGKTYTNAGQNSSANNENMHNPFSPNEENTQKRNSSKYETNHVSLRLNDYDSHILENKAYNEIPDKALKLEHKISALEQTLAKLKKSIHTLESLDYNIRLYDMKQKYRLLSQELEKLNEEYINQNIGTKLSGEITSAIKRVSLHKSFIQNIMKYLKKKIFSKISKRFSCSQNMKEALSSLSDINSSIDELINMQIPYGESSERYQSLTAYLNKANVIHANITSKIKNIS